MAHKDAATILENLDAVEVSLVPRAANKRRFLLLKAAEEERMTDLDEEFAIEILKAELLEELEKEDNKSDAALAKIQKAAAQLQDEDPTLSKAAAVSLVVQDDPSLYGEYVGDQSNDRRDAETVQSYTEMLNSQLQKRFEDSGEERYETFIEKEFKANPEMAHLWLASSSVNMA